MLQGVWLPMRVWMSLAVMTVAGAVIERPATAEDLRSYEDGPLTAADFLGEVPADPGGDANTATKLGCSYRYSYRVVGGRTTLTVEELTVEAFVRRDASWNRRPMNAALMSHEQGHADIAWISCLQARLAFQEKMPRGRHWRFTGASLEDAVAKLDAAVAEIMKPFEVSGREADAAYDRETRHGLGPKQSEWRRVHQATIEELEAKLAKQR